MPDELPDGLRRDVARLMKAAHAKGRRTGREAGFAHAFGLLIKAMAAGDPGAGGAVIPPPQFGAAPRPSDPPRPKRKKKRRVRRKGCAEVALPMGGNGTLPTETVKVRKFGSTQFDFAGHVRDAILDIGRMIPATDLAEDGRECEPHVTVKYGLHKDVRWEAVRDAARGVGPVRVWFDGFGVFRTPDHDVLYLRVRGDKIRRLNRAVAALPHTDTHTEYVAHATVAYVKPGLGDHYARQLAAHLWALPADRRAAVSCRTLVYSSAAGRRYALDLSPAPVAKALRLTPAEAAVYRKAVAEQSLDTPEAVTRYAAELHAKTVKELAAEKAKAKYHPAQHAVVDRLAEALAG